MVVLYNKGYQMIEQFILLQLIKVLTTGSNLVNFYKDQKEVGVCMSISYKYFSAKNGRKTHGITVLFNEY